MLSCGAVAPVIALWCQMQIGRTGSTLGIAEEGADHAFFAASLVAGAQGLVLAAAKPRSFAPAMGAAGIGKSTAKAAQPLWVTVTTRQVSLWHFASALLRASSTVRKSYASPKAPHAPIASAPAARAVFTATSISVAVASNSAATTTARMAGVKLSVIALLLIPLPSFRDARSASGPGIQMPIRFRFLDSGFAG
jgi:hypothetical protein